VIDLATENELLDIIATEAIVERSTLKREAALADLGIQSLDVVSVLFEIEERWGVTIDEEDLPRMANLGEVLDYLVARINAVPA
jgi:acyl carrier protein